MPDNVESRAGTAPSRQPGAEDRIELRGLRFWAAHGALPEEALRPQPFEVDLDLLVDLRPSGRSDRLSETVDYAELCEAVRSVMEGPTSACSSTSPKKSQTTSWPPPAHKPWPWSCPSGNFVLRCRSKWRLRACA